MSSLIGTAGHVDHGKTTLIKALTGIDADRLPEEKERGLTIDVGFAYIDLPTIGRVSIVDVPGHERFIGNMLVGVLGVDVAMLCVAADASVMPQTIEHFQILCLLPVKRLVVALTRSDLVDEDTVGLARAEVEELLQGTRFAGSRIVGVSAVTGTGLSELKGSLAEALQSKQRSSGGGWYLPIDRVFTVKGHGTVVTGSLMQGEVKEGEAAELMPEGADVRVRSIQSHDAPLKVGVPGTRVALNLGGVKPEDVHRGQLIGQPGTVHATSVLDARVEWLPGRSLKHGSRVRVSIGSDEAIARAFLNDHAPDLVQLRFERPVGAARGQALIVRTYSPQVLVCGGRVVAPQAKERRKNKAPLVIDEALEIDEAILQALAQAKDGAFTEDVCKAVGASAQALGTPFERLKSTGRLLGFAGFWTTPENFESAVSRLMEGLKAAHAESPTQLTLPRDQIVKRSGLTWSGKPLDRIVALLEERGDLRVSGTGIALASFAPQFNTKQQQLLEKVLDLLGKGGLNVPTLEEVAAQLRVPKQAVDEMVRLGVGAGKIKRLDEGLYFPTELLDQTADRTRTAFTGRQFSASEFRDAMATTRKFAIPVLEYFDAKGVTKRIGEKRIVN